MTLSSHNGSSPRHYDAVIIGAGLSGVGMLRRLRDDGYSAVVLESGGGVGGTWYWNRYPGACCDSASEIYSYSFSDDLLQSWSWTTRYPTQPQVLDYLDHVLERFDLRRHIEFGKRVVSAVFEESDERWRITTEAGEEFVARFCITAVGNLSAPLVPQIKGIEQFAGEVYYTSSWPHHEVDLKGKRVAVIGTGSSGIQVAPAIVDDVATLTVFQRTANYAFPSRNHPLTDEDQARIKSRYPEIREQARWTTTGNLYDPADVSALDVNREERTRRYEELWEEGGFELILGSYNDLGTDEEANRTLSDFVKTKIAEIVKDPVTLEKLMPKDHPVGTKRVPLASGYFEMFNRENVTLVDLRAEPMEKVTEHGIRTQDRAYELDVIIFATGFDAVTGTLNKIDIRGLAGERLKDLWEAGPRTYLGLMTAGFPNLFMLTGPQSPAVMGTVTISIEQHIEFLGDLLEHVRRGAVDTVDVTPEAQDEWATEVQDLVAGTLLAKHDSWHMGSNVPGKMRTILTYTGGVGTYRRRMQGVGKAGYPGFVFSSRRELVGVERGFAAASGTQGRSSASSVGIVSPTQPSVQRNEPK